MANIFRPPCDEGIIRSGTAAAPCEESAAPWILAATILGSSMAFIDGTVVNIALPALQKGLNASVLDVQWVVESYSLFLAALLLVGGALGDRFGRRLIYAIGVGVFALASLWCGLAPSIGQLIAARSFQGLGAALLVPGSLAIIGASFPESSRGQAIGTWSGFTTITSAIGPVLGGWLIAEVSWRAAFFLSIPIAILVLAITFWRVPESRAGGPRGKLDVWGAAFVTAGLGCVVYGLIRSSVQGFSNALVIASLAGGGFFLTAFFIVESSVQSPMLPLTIFRSRTFSGTNLQTFLLYAALGGALFFLPLNLIQVQGYSATAAGAAFLPLILILFLLSRWSGGLVARIGARPPLVVGPLISAVGFALLALPGVRTSYWTGFFPGMVVLGFGMAVSVAPLTTTIMNSVGADQSGIASGINNAVSRTAGLLAVAALGILMLQGFGRSLDRRLAALKLPAATERSVEGQRAKLAGIELPSDADSKTQLAIQQSISESFLFAFRLIMVVAAALAALSGWVGSLSVDGRTASGPSK